MGPIRDATQAAQALETCLLRQLIDASGVFKGTSGASGGQIHSQMFVEALADAVEKGGGIGLVRLIENSLPGAATDAMSQAEGEPTRNETPPLNMYQDRVELPVSNKTQSKGVSP